RQGEPLLELETEKSVVEIEATDSGRLVEILLQADQEASVGDRVGWLEVDAADRAAGVSGAVAVAVGPSGAMTNAGTTTSDATSAAVDSVKPPAVAIGAPARIRSSPVARRLATEHALDLRQVVGTGPQGRVQLADVRRALDGRDSSVIAARAPFSAESRD